METVIPQVQQLKGKEKKAEKGEKGKEEGAEAQIKNCVIDWWANLSGDEIFVLNKVLTGAFRVGVSSKLVIKALAAEYDLTEAVLSHRLMGAY